MDEMIAELRGLLERAESKLGHVSIPAMDGDNLAITLCMRFDNPDQPSDSENGWTEDGVAGCEATLAAIHANYADALAPLLDALTTSRDRERELEAALEPFAAMGRVMERRAAITFGRKVPDKEIVCESSGEAGMGILVMGHFRDAAALLPQAPGWGGQYKPLARNTLSSKDQDQKGSGE